MRSIFLHILLLLLLWGTAHRAAAEPFSRRVLGIYNSAEGKTLEFNPLREQVETILHYLGLHLDYRDIADGLPEQTEMASYRGILVWIETDSLPQVERFWQWQEEQLRAGRRLVLLNGIGPIFDGNTGRRISLDRINRTLSLMGLKAGDNYSSLPLDIELVRKVPEVVEFERKLIYELTRFHQLSSTSPDNEVFLQLRMKSTGALADAVVLTPNGGYVGSSYLRYVDGENGKRQWRVDPFFFFSRALGVEQSPRPDCTTLNGNRIYYSHIDGDGLINLSLVDQKSASGEIVLDQILTAYPDLPFTASVIVTEVEPETIGSPESMALARRIFRLPNVEPASHTYAHPLIWSTDLTSEYTISRYLHELEYARMSGKGLIAWPVENYEYDPYKETVWTCRYIEEKLLPPGEQCRILLWSGNCLPDEETLRMCAEAGLQNMNGGDSRFDGDFPSYSTIAPLYRQVGDYYQIHSSNTNENIYTDLWSGPYGGYQNVLQTFENSESPRRILPVNVYYHFYSGERQASLLALKRVYEWVVARREALFPLFASRFIDVVHGFISTRIEQVEERTWKVAKNGQCRTVRFDHCALYPDLEGGRGILGFRHYQGALYVSLDESGDHLIPLSETPPTRPYLLRATADVLDFVVDESGAISYRSAALGPATFLWANLDPDAAYAVLLQRDEQSSRQIVRTDSQGGLRVVLDLRGEALITIARDGGGS